MLALKAVHQLQNTIEHTGLTHDPDILVNTRTVRTNALMRWLGGIAVNREKSNNLVAASVEAIRAAPGALQLVVPPEGTRSKVRYWKTGFYYIAHGAGVPIVLSYMDYARKVSGIGPVFHPTGDIDRDMETIKAFYAPFKGKNPDQSGH